MENEKTGKGGENAEWEAIKKAEGGKALAIQWLGLSILTSVALGSIPGRELRSHKSQRMAKRKESRWS